MPIPVLLAHAPRDHRIADTVRRDLTRRGWRPEPVAFGARRGERWNGSPLVALLPSDPAEHELVLPSLRELAGDETPIVVIVDPALPAPDWLFQGVARALVPFGDGREYDAFFDDLVRALQPALPPWLDLRVRPTILQRPRGVAWWSHDVVVADDRFEHVVRIGLAGSNVLVPGLSEPHHVTIDRREVVVANTGADELLCAAVEDGMTTELTAVREADGPLLRPHLGANAGGLSVVCDTDNHRVLVQDRRLRDAAPGGWTELEAPGGFRHPGAAFSDGRRILVADTENRRLLSYAPGGRLVATAGLAGAEPSSVTAWRDLVLVGDERGGTVSVHRQAADGTLEPVLEALAPEWIRSPAGLAVDAQGTLAVSDRGARCVWLLELGEALAGAGD